MVIYIYMWYQQHRPIPPPPVVWCCGATFPPSPLWCGVAVSCWFGFQLLQIESQSLWGWNIIVNHSGVQFHHVVPTTLCMLIISPHTQSAHVFTQWPLFKGTQPVTCMYNDAASCWQGGVLGGLYHWGGAGEPGTGNIYIYKESPGIFIFTPQLSCYK